MKWYWRSVGSLSNMADIFIWRERETQRHARGIPYDNGAIDWSDESTSQGIPKIAGNNRSPDKGMKQILP